jgi:hypothetical protein
MSVDPRLIAKRPTATGRRYRLRPPKSKREISELDLEAAAPSAPIIINLNPEEETHAKDAMHAKE